MRTKAILASLFVLVVAVFAFRLGSPLPARAGREAGPTSVIVNSQFGGQIFGFDIDQNGTEGVLSEAQTLNGNGKILAAVETFDQATGQILSVVKKLESQDDFLTLGIVGNSVGLVEREHEKKGQIYVTKRIYEELSPLSSNKFTAKWKSGLVTEDIIMGVSRNQGAGGTFTNAILYFENSGDFNTLVFGTNFNTKKSGPHVTLTDPTFFFSNEPAVGYDYVTNQAVVAASDGAVGGPAPQIALVDLTAGTVTQFTGILGPPPYHQGSINGLAVDSEDGIAVTTTELDARVEFYNLKKQTGFAVTLPGDVGQLQSGTDVEYDPVNKLFFVAQSVSSTGPGSSIQVYDTKGNLIESLNGFNFSNSFNVIGTHIGLNPANRTGYVDGPSSGVTQLQQFTY
ncbi:MAG TPA: hypothetical protein VMI10_08880 [Terriglobales bacterium]|nr:hypothetical protein [Terriglobales bacterium]